MTKIRTINLLDQVRSLLTTIQWTLLSNLIHSYDEHNALAIAKDFVKDINCFYPKLRYKIDKIKTLEIVTVICQPTESFILSNHNFNSLPHHDRSILLHGIVDKISCLSVCLIVHESGLIDISAFRNGMEATYDPVPFEITVNIISSLNQDANLIKLLLSILAFCTSNCTTSSEKTSLKYLADIRSFLNVQNMLYAEVL
ncbi:unnamed protein product [Rotaria magnacalcarata]|uniref:Uncharacterized protein n=1 Tax=Rotaria magnacalcarata TaxID=392030 RepID=A0A815LXQ0_9BILA|nr:unnamed protein product [Rotaria magnacalcarata]CAF3823387.1 unnamed protein product [Rotaria magnacalcarata]